MTKEAAARIQSSEALKNGGKIEKGSFAARAMRTASIAENNKAERKESIIVKTIKCTSNLATEPNPNYPSKTGKPSGKKRGNTPKGK